MCTYIYIHGHYLDYNGTSHWDLEQQIQMELLYEGHIGTISNRTSLGH